MTPVRALTRTGAAWFVPLMFALSCLFATRSTFPSGYPAGDLAQSSVGLYVAAPLSAAFMALQYRGFTHLITPLRVTRSGVVVAFRAWWPLLLGPPAALVMAVMVTAGAFPNDLAAWSLVFIDFLTVLTAVLTGLVFAWAIPTVVAVPLVAVLWFVWIGYGPASTSTLVHNLDSTFGCCSSDTRPATVAVQATVLLLTVITVGIGCLLASPRAPRFPRPPVAAALTLLIVAAFASGVAMLRTADQPLNLTATEPRTTPLSCRAIDGVEVCLWPENRDRAETVAAVVAKLNPELTSVGMRPINALTQANRNADAVSVEAGEGLSEQEIRLGVVFGYIDLQSGCRGTVGPARDRVAAFVGLLAGAPPDELATRFGSSSMAAARLALAQLQEAPKTGGVWFRRELSEVDCARAG